MKADVRFISWATLAALLLVSQPAVGGDEGQAPIKTRQPAPDFTLKDDRGKDLRLSDLWKKRGKNVLLAFYPKDFTGG